tara:strand:- start:322 stop:432 length:111 start_codon:yes stop_codon:yes gene_type:complete
MKKLLWNILEAFVLLGTLTAIYLSLWIVSIAMEGKI